MKNPIIGITLDYDNKNTSVGGYSDYPWYALRRHYVDAIRNNGGTPILLPYCKESIDDYIGICSGFIFPGGEYDIHPSYYGQDLTEETNISDDVRTNFEIALMQKVLDHDKPMLAICAGQQLLNVISGGSLYQHIEKDIKNALSHRHHLKQNEAWHNVKFARGTKLQEIVGVNEYKTNSHHHQSINKLGNNLIVNGVAEDGVIEGIEHLKHRFCIGVEWHPEYEDNEYDRKIFKAFIKEASK